MFFYTFITCTVTGEVLLVKDENGKGTRNDWPNDNHHLAATQDAYR